MTQVEGPAQRLRILFARGDEVRYISHLDMMRMWERILRRAHVPMAYTHGFNPQPRLALAAPLPVGITSEGEVLDIFLTAPLSPTAFRQAVEPQTPPGITILRVTEEPVPAPSLQSQLRSATYAITLDTPLTRDEVAQRIHALLARTEIPREWHREKSVKRYDLRPLIEDITIARWNGERVLELRVKSGPTGSGRPEEVLSSLDLADDVVRIHRTSLGFAPE